MSEYIKPRKKQLRLLYKSIATAFCAVLLSASACTLAYGEGTGIQTMYCDAEPPVIDAEACVLLETVSGKVLYERNRDEKLYPASMAKIMTAMIALDFLNPDDIIIVGNEINSLPPDASRTKHKIGEAITVRTLMAAMFLSSGNDSACILAARVGREIAGAEELSYSSAEKLFCEKMNKKAFELGAVKTNFTNAHGYHNAKQFTTAYDFALICEAALKYPLIKETAGMKQFKGNGAGAAAAEYPLTQDYDWNSGNLLLYGEYAYQYATGLRTGQTDEAGSCLAASAEKDGKQLICVLLRSTEDGRWTEAKQLFDYGFDNFNTETIQTAGTLLGTVAVANTPLGIEQTIDYLTAENYSDFISKKQLEDIKKHVSFFKELLYVPEEGEESPKEAALVPPISAGDVIGKVSYIINDELVFSSDIIAGNSVAERTFNTDMEYYIQKVRNIFFSKSALPYWIIFFLVAGIIVRVIFVIRRGVKEKRKGLKFR